MIPTQDHVAALREIVTAAKASEDDPQRLARAFADADRLLKGGERDPVGDRTPSAMEAGMGGGDIETAIGHTDDGYVIMRFDRLVQWVRWHPMAVVDIAEAMIKAAQAGSKIWMPRSKKLPGLGG